MIRALPSQWLDRLALSASGLCAMHCLTLPLMLVLMPALGASFLGDAAFHRSLLWLVIPSSLMAVTFGCLRHRDARVWFHAAVGLVLMVVAAFWGHDLVGFWGEKAVTLIGVGFLSAGHIRNYTLCRQDHCEHGTDVR